MIIIIIVSYEHVFKVKKKRDLLKISLSKMVAI